MRYGRESQRDERIQVVDILRNFYVDVRCVQCGDFTVRADVVAASQRLLAEGCPGSQFECPPELLAGLLEPTFLESLERAGSDLDRTREIAVFDAPHGHALRISVRAVPRLDTINLLRWEDDGGYCTLPSPTLRC